MLKRAKRLRKINLRLSPFHGQLKSFSSFADSHVSRYQHYRHYHPADVPRICSFHFQKKVAFVTASHLLVQPLARPVIRGRKENCIPGILRQQSWASGVIIARLISHHNHLRFLDALSCCLSLAFESVAFPSLGLFPKIITDSQLTNHFFSGNVGQQQCNRYLKPLLNPNCS